jgi:hypothetical protein
MAAVAAVAAVVTLFPVPVMAAEAVPAAAVRLGLLILIIPTIQVLLP